MIMEEKHFGPLWFIRGENHGRYPFCHSIYIEGAGVLIDPSSDRRRLTQIRDVHGVREIWLSHWHEDHFMHLDLFDDLPLCISEPDAPPLADLDLLLDWYGFDDEYRIKKRSTFAEEFHFRQRKPTRFLGGGEVINLDGVTVDVISTPGHTPGHLSFYFREPGVLFLGDYDLTPFGPWYGDVASSIEATIQSVERLRKLPASVWLASHETGVFESAPEELWEQYLRVIDEREKKLLALLEKPKTIEEIAQAGLIYGKQHEPISFIASGERLIMEKHLRRCMGRRLISEESGKYFRS
ncbi:MBL fold metallo-hydrolase [Thermodesulfobacteriota bacterium]